MFSQAASDEPFWGDVYRRAFPSFNCMSSTIGNREAQLCGVDRIIVLDNGVTRRVDEKKRSQTYPDILLETVSNDQTGAPGWMNKDLQIDYLAYAFMDTQRVHFFPWDFLRRAWHHHGKDWEYRFPHKVARNHGYCTISVAVPIPVLTRVLATAFVVDRVPARRLAP